MSLVLPTLISAKPEHPFVLLESSASQSCLPVLQATLDGDERSDLVLLFCLLHPPSSLVNGSPKNNVVVHDLTSIIPGYGEGGEDINSSIAAAINAAPSGSLTVVVDSADTLCSDLGSASRAYDVLEQAMTALQARSSASRLIVHINSPSPLLPLLITTSFLSTIAYVRAHPPALLLHLAQANLTPPPPSTPAERFWPVFTPLASRAWEVEKIVYGSDGPGLAEGWSEIVLEVLVRGPSANHGKRRGTERTLEGWSRLRGFCDITELQSIQSVWGRQSVKEAAPDPTQNLSFNLNLTPDQQQSRASVPLPYAFSSEANAAPQAAPSTIYYDPDSADDIDDDDPDEDLDI